MAIGTPGTISQSMVAARHLVVLAALSATSVACRAEMRKAAPTASEARAASPQGPPAEESWVAASVPQAVGMMKLFDAEPDRSRKVTSGPFRAVLRGKKLELAPDVLSSEICNAFIFRNSWYFVTSDGDIFRAESFLGRPVDVGASVGRIAILSTVVLASIQEMKSRTAASL